MTSACYYFSIQENDIIKWINMDQFITLFLFFCAVGDPSPNGVEGHQLQLPPGYRTCFEFVKLVSKAVRKLLILGTIIHCYVNFELCRLFVCLGWNEFFNLFKFLVYFCYICLKYLFIIELVNTPITTNFSTWVLLQEWCVIF